MAESTTDLLSLLPHRSYRGHGVRRVAGRVELAEPQWLRLRYLLEANPRCIRIPTPVSGGGRADRLWSHTCFEAFLGFEGSPRYLELNFSPSGQWAAYRFESYREGMAAAALEESPRVAVSGGEERLELQAEVRLPGALPERDCAARAGAGVRIALSAVVEEQEGGLSYWALRHPPGRPDFHHPDGFSLTLEFPRNRTP